MSYCVSLVIDTGGKEPFAVVDNINHTSNVSELITRAMGFPLGALDGRNGHFCPMVLERAVGQLKAPENLVHVRKLEPSNGYGTLETTIEFLEEFREACIAHPICTVRITGAEAWPPKGRSLAIMASDEFEVCDTDNQFRVVKQKSLEDD